jgi:hypothetical protein
MLFLPKSIQKEVFVLPTLNLPESALREQPTRQADNFYEQL